MKRVILILIVIFCQTGFGQNISVFDIDTSAFPVMKAKFFAFGSDGKQIKSFGLSDFKISENGADRTVLSVSCPPDKDPDRLSSVIVVDVSGSMMGNPLLIAKTVAKTWVNALPLGQSNCAVTSFSDGNYFNQDFTTNRNKLISAIDAVGHGGGTDYNMALIEPVAGGILVAKTAKHKKIIIFITDGQPNENPDETRIINEAKANGIIIHCISINLPAHTSMKHFSEQTGGLCFENVKTEDEAKKISEMIINISLFNSPCEINWLSGPACFAGITNVELQIISLRLTATSNYENQFKSIAKLEFNPATVSFINPILGVKKDTTVKLNAKNADFNVTNIISSNPGFNIKPKSFMLKNGQSIDLTISYFPVDSAYNFCRFSFENDLCPSSFYATGGWKGKRPSQRTLKLVHPNGGEVFPVGMDTVITWEGVLPDEYIKIEYSTDNGLSWMFLSDTCNNFSYKWHVPNTPSNQCLARVTAAIRCGIGFDSNMVLIPSGTFQRGNTGGFSGANGDESPIHTVTISRDFFISKYETTQEQYQAVMGNNPSLFKGKNLPVEQVSWYDAVQFCNKLSLLECLDTCYVGSGANISCNWAANGYRLPTDAEWEYACRAGTSTDFYNGKITNSSCSPLDVNLDKISWYCGNSGNTTHPVGLKLPNNYGLYDMSGNVREWCWDWYSFFNNNPLNDPKGPATGTIRVFRGGSFDFEAQYNRSSDRCNYFPNQKDRNLGFRVVSVKY